MKKGEELLRELQEQGKKLEIPQGLEPKWMQETLEEQDRRQYFRRGKLYPALATAACLCLLAGGMLKLHGMGLLFPAERQAGEEKQLADEAEYVQEDALSQEVEKELVLPVLSYEEIYEKLSVNWQEWNITNGGIREEEAFETAGALESGADAVTEDLAVSAGVQKQYSGEEAAFGKTNVQVEEIDEADRIKNDGRYLYQIAYKEKETGVREGSDCGIQIVDTRDGLKEVAYLDDFESMEEFYVWKDLLITIENRYFEAAADPQAKSAGVMACYDLAYEANRYHEIRIFDLTDRSNPQEIKKFTLQGSYEASRISDGYFYGISRFTAQAGEGQEDYEAYIPTVDGQQIAAEKIYCPAYEEGTSYLVLVSIDLEKPTVLKDSRAVLSSSGLYYMSRRNLYLTSYESVYANTPKEEGTCTDKTRLLRFAYLNGQFYAKAEGEIPGQLESSFSLDEYNGNLRLVSTVQESETKRITDDRTGEILGYDFADLVQTNALYVLDRDLTILGKIENLAEEERIYSARFLGDTGYFVTFRQTDPLFAVDLSEPENPRILGELKVSGFSEYLHFWKEDLLLGIGMEADEETGQQECLKLSMFDISEPAQLTETARKELTGYDYSEALYDHKAVLIDTEENLIGFCAEGSDRGSYVRQYVVYAYEDGEFVQKLKLETKAENGAYYRLRGTFIGDTFYLLSEDGTVQSYDRNTGKQTEKL